MIRYIARHHVWILGALAACPLIWGCNPDGPITVNSYYGPGIQFSGLGTNYAWAPEQTEPRLGAPGFHELVRSSVEKRLMDKGFALTPGGHPDFWVDYRLARKEKTDASVVAFGQTVEEGSLILQVLDPASRKMIWWGIASAKINDSDTPDVRKRRLDSAMRQLMQKFPAKAK